MCYCIGGKLGRCIVVDGCNIGCFGGARTACASVAVVIAIVVSVGCVDTMLLPQALSLLIACRRTISKVMIVSTSPTLHSSVFCTLHGTVGLM